MTAEPSTAAEEADPLIGKALGGLVAEARVAEGSTGRVYRARRADGTAVALKVLHPRLVSDPEVLARFRRESRLIAQLRHPGIVRVLDEVPPAPELDAPAVLALEWVSGESLRATLSAAGGWLPWPRALDLLTQLAEALGAAHAGGVVHRDLKPENVMVTRSGEAERVKVLDFGVARVFQGESSLATQRGAVFGTPRYASPEVAQGLAVDPRADVYSLGVMAFEGLSGRPPFDDPNPVTTLLAHLSRPVPALAAPPGAPPLPEDLIAVVGACLAKRPAERPQDGQALAALLRGVATAHGLEARPDDLARDAPGVAPTPPDPAERPPAEARAASSPGAGSRPRPEGVRWALSCLAATVALAALWWAAQHWR